MYCPFQDTGLRVSSPFKETALIVRGPRPSDNFAQIHNAALADGRLSFKARGILAFLLSRPPGWKTSAEKLAKSGIDGERAVKSGLKELEAHGYLQRSRTHADGSDPAHPAGTWIHNQVITDQPTIGAKQPDGENETPNQDTIGTLCTGGKQPDINNTELITLTQEGGVVNSPTVEEPQPPLTSRNFEYGKARDVDGDELIDGPKVWRPSEAAIKTARANITILDIELSITKYRIRVAELHRDPSSSEWLRWLINDEQEAEIKQRENRVAAGAKKQWWE
jgi:hypothetical protein